MITKKVMILHTKEWYKKVEIGDLIKVFWDDAKGFVNEPVKNVAVEKTISWGIVWKMDKKELVLCKSIYPADGDGDFEAIPRPWTTKIEIIRKGEYMNNEIKRI